MTDDATNELKATEEIVRNLWRITRFINSRINVELGCGSEEDFQKESEEFDKMEKNHFSPEELVKRVSYLKALLPDVDNEDTAELLNVDYEELEKVLKGQSK